MLILAAVNLEEAHSVGLYCGFRSWQRSSCR